MNLYRRFKNLIDNIAARKLAEKALVERMKELNCIYSLSDLIEKPGTSLENILQGSVDLLPPAMQYPQFACARLNIDGQSFTSENYQDSSRKISCALTSDGQTVGTLEVGYLDKLPNTDGQPFLDEEVKLLENIAERLGQVRDRWLATRALQESTERHQVFIAQSFEAIYRIEFDHPIDSSLPVETQIDQIYQNAYIAECNQALADMYNLPSPDALVGMRLVDAHGGSDNPVNRQAFQKFIASGYKSTADETVEKDKNGKPIWFLSNTIGIVENGYLVRLWSTSINITDRKKMEETLRYSEEKFHKAFHSSPDAILITRLSDGQILEVNEGFHNLTEYTREEALAHTSIALALWANPPDRQRVIADLQRNQRIQGYEIDFRIKSGRILNCLYSGEIIQIGSETCILSVVRDITSRKRTDKILQLRLKLWEYATTHSSAELMQKALDEIETFSDSPISFYHIVDENQIALSLQAWSTRTQESFCTSQGKGMHYPIDQAGVWVDCVRERKAVIHNNYASLPHKKGLPEGHAAIVRELVAPTMRDGRVVSILGVGNKPSDYNEQDVEVVSYVADVVWTIVEQKKAEEQIRQLNARLEQLAMTDDLTELENRRSFFLRGNEEIKKARRYHTPLSLIMLDIDHFKQVNDTYGHEIGDLYLRCIAHILQKNVRETDILARLGGEEFSILLPNTAIEEAGKLAERLRLEVEKTVCSNQYQNLIVTISVGVTAYSQATLNLDAMLRIADQAMYEAKNQGRNRVVSQD